MSKDHVEIVRALSVRKHECRLVATDATGNASAQGTFRWRVVD
jgi:hypothetical protein